MSCDIIATVEETVPFTVTVDTVSLNSSVQEVTLASTVETLTISSTTENINLASVVQDVVFSAGVEEITIAVTIEGTVGATVDPEVWPTYICESTDFTAEPYKVYYVDGRANDITITPPATIDDCGWFRIIPVFTPLNSFTMTILKGTTNGFNGQNDDLLMDIQSVTLEFVYQSGTNEYHIHERGRFGSAV